MYLLSVRFGEDSGPDEGTSEHVAEMASWAALNRRLSHSGDLVWSLALADPRTAAVVTSGSDGSDADPRREVPDPAAGGVFALYLLDVADEAAAIGWAEQMPACAYGSVEVRKMLSHETAHE